MNTDITEAQRVLKIEANAIMALQEKLDGKFVQALEILQGCQGKVIVTGIGKSGHIARKIASTMSSTGTPAVFMHPAESSHGDLGVVETKDVVIGISYGGEAQELQDLLRFVVRKQIKMIAMTAKLQSSLAKAATVVLDVGVKEEACPLGLAPTASSTCTLALGDALSMALLKRRGFKEEDFAEFHPGGALGRRLLTRVEDVMHGGESLAVCKPESGMRDVLALMTQKEVRGVAGVIDASSNLIGIITDGDIRRRLEKSHNPLDEKAQDLMSKNPKTVDAQELAEKALFMMEQFRIQTLFVVRKDSPTPNQPVGILHLQDLLRAKIR